MEIARLAYLRVKLLFGSLIYKVITLLYKIIDVQIEKYSEGISFIQFFSKYVLSTWRVFR